MINFLGDFKLINYKPCTNCGYKTGLSKPPKCGVKKCWRCGRGIKQSFSGESAKND